MIRWMQNWLQDTQVTIRLGLLTALSTTLNIHLPPWFGAHPSWIWLTWFLLLGGYNSPSQGESVCHTFDRTPAA